MATASRKIRLPYSKRLFMWLAGYSILLMGCFVTFQYHREKNFKADEINSQLQLINTYIITEIEKGIDIRDIELDDFHMFDDLRVSVIESTGNIIYDNALDSIREISHIDRKEIAEAIRYGVGYTVRRHSRNTEQSYFYSAKKGDTGIIVRSAIPYTVSFTGLLRADYGFLWFTGVVATVMCLLGYFATRRLGQNISRLNAFAELAEKGEKICDSEPFPHDELGEISNNIVRLYSRLQTALSERDREHSAALREQKEKERIKKRLTNNINHELKTPVASIQVCLETIKAHKDMSAEKRMEFIDRCLNNSERLKKLLTDVSLITRMDDGNDAIEMTPVDLYPTINAVAEEITPIAEAKGFEIEVDISRHLPLIGNRSLIESVFRNLLDNAIAYSGGNRIVIRQINSNDDNIAIALFDNGNGIPEEHLPKIFERFYRIDKGRSRAAGGTGLGLSIVKNAILLHHGSITAENLATGGLMFNIIFPRAV